MWAWQFMKALSIQRANGWSRFVSMQNHLNLLYREEEREMLPLCRSEGIGVIPWSPLARGKLARPWEDEPSTERAATDAFGKSALRAHGATPTARSSSACRRSPRRAACRRRRSRSPGSCRSPASPRRSSAPPSRSIWRTPSPRSRQAVGGGDQGARGALRPARGRGILVRHDWLTRRCRRTSQGGAKPC